MPFFCLLWRSTRGGSESLCSWRAELLNSTPTLVCCRRTLVQMNSVKMSKKKQRLLSRIQFPLFSSFAFERPDVLFPQCNILWIILKDFKHNFACMLYFLSDYAGNVERRNRLTGRFSVFRTGTHTIHVELISQGNKSTRRTWVKVNYFLQNTIQLYNGTELNRSVDHRNKA